MSRSDNRGQPSPRPPLLHLANRTWTQVSEVRWWICGFIKWERGMFSSLWLVYIWRHEYLIVITQAARCWSYVGSPHEGQHNSCHRKGEICDGLFEKIAFAILIIFFSQADTFTAVERKQFKEKVSWIIWEEQSIFILINWMRAIEALYNSSDKNIHERSENSFVFTASKFSSLLAVMRGLTS